MRLKVPFLRYALAGAAFLLPSIVFAAVLPFLINAQPVRAKLLRELGAWTGADVKLAGAISVKDFFSLSVEARDVEIGGFKGLPSIESMKAEKIVARIAWFNLLSGRFDFDKIKISGAVFRMRVGGLREAGMLAADLLSSRRETPFDAMLLDDSVIALRAGGRKPYRRLEVKNVLARTAKSGKRLISSASLAWRGQPFRLTARTVFATPGTGRNPLRMEFASGLVAGSFDGEAALGSGEAEGAFSLVTPDLAKAADWLELGVDPSALGQNASASGGLAISPEEITLTSAEIALAGQTAQTALTLKRGGAMPRLEGVLAFDRLDLTGMFTGEARSANGPAGVPTPVERVMETDLRISAKTLAWNGRQAGSAALVVTSTPERLSVEIAELMFLGGEVRGHVALDSLGRARRAAARLSAEGVDAGEFLGMADQRGWLGGKADVKVEVEAAWDDPSKIDDMLTARARVNFPEGGQIHFDVPKLARPALTPGSGWGGVDFANAVFERLRFDMSFRQGQISFANVVLSAPGFNVNGRGEIDLAAKSLDWGLTLLPRDGERESAAADAGAGTASGSRLSIKGPWAAPIIRSQAASSNLSPKANNRAAAALELSASGR
jgi:AsmA protein